MHTSQMSSSAVGYWLPIIVTASIVLSLLMGWYARRLIARRKASMPVVDGARPNVHTLSFQPQTVGRPV